MLTINLEEKELAALISALESYLPELATERVGTDNRGWHTELKAQEVLLAEILKRFKAL